MKKTTVLGLASMLTLGTAAPSFAADNALGGVFSLLGSVTAAAVDVPQAIVVDSLWRVPKKVQRTLAEHFGDEKGFQQNVAGAVIGIPVGMLWGVPYGALHGVKHGLGTGWEKPFSTESFIVTEDSEK